MSLKIDYIFSLSGGRQAELKLGVDVKLMFLSIDKSGYGDKTLDESVLELLDGGQKTLGIQKAYKLSDETFIIGYD